MTKAKTSSDDAIAKELACLDANNQALFARRRELTTLLKDSAAKRGNFKVVVPGVGVVKVSAPKEKSLKGTAPECVIETFINLPERERDKLTEKGIITMAEQWSGAYYGSVTVELF